MGSIVLGAGFSYDPAEVDALIYKESEERNKKMFVCSYLSGEEMTFKSRISLRAEGVSTLLRLAVKSDILLTDNQAP